MTKVTLASVGNVIDATTAAATINSNNAAIVAAIENTLSRDGTQPDQMNATLDMNSNRIINVPAPQASTDLVRLADLTSITVGGLTQSAGLTLKGNSGTVAATPSDINILSLPAKTPVGSSDVFLIQDASASNVFKKATLSAVSAGLSGSVFIPNARLSPVSNSPRVATDVTSSTLYYTDGISNNISLNISALTIGQYDVFYQAGALTTATLNLGRTMTFYVGSINVSVAGQVTCNISVMPLAKWEVYNAYYQRKITVIGTTQELDFQYCPTNSSNSMQPFNNNTNNCAFCFTGLAEDVEVVYLNRNQPNSLSGAYGILTGIGWNSTSVVSGIWGGGTHDDSNFAGGALNTCKHIHRAATGLNTVTMLVGAALNSANHNSVIYSRITPTANSTVDTHCQLTISWMG